jgi:alpha-tubulin suppressor-like RCC1 family protein
MERTTMTTFTRWMTIFTLLAGCGDDAAAPDGGTGARDGGHDRDARGSEDGGLAADTGPVRDGGVPDGGGADAGAIAIRFATPADGTSIAEFPLEVRAVLDPPSTTASLALEIDAISVASVADASEIAATVDTLVVGPHTIRAVARTSDGSMLEASIEITAEDVVGPGITIDRPRDGVSTQSRLLRVRGATADESSAVTLAFEHGGETMPVTVEADGTFAAEVLLDRGPNAIELVATDSSGNESRETIRAWFGSRVSAGGAHSATIHDGTLYTWGRNTNGQVGNGTDSEIQASPFAIAIVDPVSVVARQTFTIALAADGRVHGFGQNADGQLGLGTPPTETDPAIADVTPRRARARGPEMHRAGALAPSIRSAVAIAAGYNHTLVLLADGTVLAFGDNASGQLGDGTTTDRSWPLPVPGLRDVVALAAGSQHSLALTRAGAVYAWGRNTYGNLGNGTADATAHGTPALVPGLTGIVAIASGRDHVLALRDDGVVMAWGLDGSGQVGNGLPEDDVTTPAAVLDLSGVENVLADGNMSYAILASGHAMGWGQNFNGQLGLGDTEERDRPTTMILLLENVIELEPGATHVFAATSTGELYGWGWSFMGSLGDPLLMDRWSYSAPVAIALP